MRLLFFLLTSFLLLSCKEEENPDNKPVELYFPPISGTNWETLDPVDLNWNMDELEKLKRLLEENGTRGFILLKGGRIVVEEYYGKRLTGNLDFDQNSLWYWASAGKTLTATLIGMAQNEGYLDLSEPSSDYLGQGWTSMSGEQEKNISIWHHLTMTSGLDDGVGDKDDFSPSNLQYLAEPGNRWAYHNAPYTLLDRVIETSTGRDFSDYFDQKLATKIGMTGSWQRLGYNHVFFSNARSMARFGLLILANGDWAGEPVIKDKTFLNHMINTSQNLNESYGYLWWLNGKSSFMVPSLQIRFPGSFAPNAPMDMVCGLGKDGQYVCVVPSMDLVLVRMGLSPDQSLVPFMFLDDIWKILKNIIPSP
ncbi:serine hydrolase domain-containing protein [Shivajiella indica]|uniref:Serine hydrolase domain-containing protein n=1 Tax=Shivajiella indica TaxID=872115 RepID=A0ABW5B9P5_9BACT